MPLAVRAEGVQEMGFIDLFICLFIDYLLTLGLLVQAVMPLADTAEGVQESWGAMQDELYYWREERDVLQVTSYRLR
jgi:hypothetical protein